MLDILNKLLISEKDLQKVSTKSKDLKKQGKTISHILMVIYIWQVIL